MQSIRRSLARAGDALRALSESNSLQADIARAIDVVASWLGHSPLIAAQHYLQTRDAHFDMAAGGAMGGATGDVPDGPECSGEAYPKSVAQSGAPMTQNAAQHATASDGMGSPDSHETACFAGDLRADANKRSATANQGNGRYWARTSDLHSVIVAR